MACREEFVLYAGPTHPWLLKTDLVQQLDTIPPRFIRTGVNTKRARLNYKAPLGHVG